MMRKTVLACACLLLPALSMAADPALPAVDAVVAEVVGQDAPGIAVLVSENGEIRHLKGYGLADLEAEIPVSPDTLFDLASVSKQMTALAAAILIEEGTLTLDTEVRSLIKSFDVADENRPVTVGDLVFHLAGLPDYWNQMEGYGHKTDNAAVVEWLSGMPLLRAPGTHYEYSNSAYLLLGSTIAAADGAADLRAVLNTRVWQPLGMKSTGLVSAPAGVATTRLAKGYKGSEGEFEPSRFDSLVQGDGSVLSSVRDLALYEAALVNGDLLEDTDQLFVNGSYDNGEAIDDGDGAQAGYGFGWSLYTRNGQRYAGHAGSWMGTATYYQRNLDSGISVIVLANGEDAATQSLAEAIEDALE